MLIRSLVCCYRRCGLPELSTQDWRTLSEAGASSPLSRHWPSILTNALYPIFPRPAHHHLPTPNQLLSPVDPVSTVSGFAPPGRTVLVKGLPHLLHARQGAEGRGGRDGDDGPVRPREGVVDSPSAPRSTPRPPSLKDFRSCIFVVSFNALPCPSFASLPSIALDEIS